MTICIATDNDITVECGITTFNRHLMQSLQLAGHAVVLLCVEEQGDEHAPDAYIHENGMLRVVLKSTYLKIKNRYKRFYKPGGFDAPRWIAMGLAFQEWLLAHAKKQNIDLVEVSDFGGAGIFLCTEGLPPVVITSHGSLLQYCRYNHCRKEAQYHVIERLEQLSFSYAHAVITHSRLSYAGVQTFSKAHVWQAPIPWLNALSPAGETGEAYIAVAGSLQVLKGAEVVCKALVQLMEKGRNIIVHWIGGDTITSAEYGSMAAYLSKRYPAVWNRHFIWKNKKTHNETIAALRKAMFVMVPSLWETFGYVALEAAALGKALILSDKAGAAELFTHGKNAVVVPAGNAAALAYAITELYDAQEKRMALGSSARSLMDAAFAETIIEKRLAIYRHVIANFKGHHPAAVQALLFLKQYHTTKRAVYFRLRSAVKKWLRG